MVKEIESRTSTVMIFFLGLCHGVYLVVLECAVDSIRNEVVSENDVVAVIMGALRVESILKLMNLQQTKS
jgi:hypothetical protein